MDIAIVSCGSKKIWEEFPHAGAVRAGDVYVGSFSGKTQEYAEMFYPGKWYILSAKYGFISPDFMIPETYDVSFINDGINVLNTEILVKQIQNNKNLRVADNIIVVGGNDYVKKTTQAFSGRRVRDVLAKATGMGYMMEMMDDAIKRGRPL